MLLPGRHANTSDYRYGFQNQELDNEIKGEGNSINFKYRMHDPRVGRFFATDPLERQYSYLSPYHFSHNSPIYTKEIEGLEGIIPTYGMEYSIPDRVGMSAQEKREFYDQIQDNKNSSAMGAITGVGIWVAAIGGYYFGTWIILNPVTAAEVANEATATAWGLLLDDPYPGPAIGDDLTQLGRRLYKTLAKENVETIADVSRSIYKSLTANIPEQVRALKIPLKEQARRAFDLRNKAKAIAREVSGPELKKAAEKNSAERYNGSIFGPTFEELFNKNLKKAKDELGLEGDESIEKAYNLIIDGTTKSNKAVDAKVLKNG